jgi:hypothetical protein
MNFKDVLNSNTDWIFSIENTSTVYILCASSNTIYIVTNELGITLGKVLLEKSVNEQDLQSLKNAFPECGDLNNSKFEVFTKKEEMLQVYADEISFKQNLKYRMT